MAAAPSDKKKVMDVAKPGKTAPSATTRPLIVSHNGTFIDPTVNNDVQSAPVPSADDLNGKNGITLTKPRGPKVVQPLSANTDKPEEAPEEKQAETEEKLPILPIETVDETDATSEESTPEIAAPATQDEADPDVSDEDSSTPPEQSSEPPADSEADESSTESDAKAADAPDNETGESSKDDSGNDSDNAAIVDAVVDQANIGKKQKEEDKETVARKELVSKLIEEKKYLIPIKQKNTTRSGRMTVVLSVLGVLVVLGGYAAVDAGVINPGFDVPFHILKKKEVATSVTTPAATPVANMTSPAQSTTPAAPPTTLEYVNKDLGVSFSYSSAWGDVAVKKQSGSISGNSVTFTFSKQPLLAAGMLSRDYKEQGRDGVCYVALGILPPSTLATITGLVTESDAQASQTSTTRILKKTADTFIYERFETGGSTGTEACLGLSTIGYVAFKSTAPYTGIQFYWGGDAQSRKPVPLSELNAYKATPSKYLDDVTRQGFVSMVESAKSQ